jgi:hypothetical protein
MFRYRKTLLIPMVLLVLGVSAAIAGGCGIYFGTSMLSWVSSSSNRANADLFSSMDRSVMSSSKARNTGVLFLVGGGAGLLLGVGTIAMGVRLLGRERKASLQETSR